MATVCADVIKAWALIWQAASTNSLSATLLFLLSASSKVRDVLQLLPHPGMIKCFIALQTLKWPNTTAVIFR